MAQLSYTPRRYELKSIGEKLRLEKGDASLIKARELAKTPIPSTFTRFGIDIRISRFPTVENGMLKVSVRAWKDGRELWVNNPLYFKNPPIMVPDGTYHKIIDEKGKEQDVMNLVEDPLEALKQIIADTVRISAK